MKVFFTMKNRTANVSCFCGVLSLNASCPGDSWPVELSYCLKWLNLRLPYSVKTWAWIQTVASESDISISKFLLRVDELFSSTVTQGKPLREHLVQARRNIIKDSIIFIFY